MDRKQAAEKIKIMQAWVDEKPIQYRTISVSNTWIDVSKDGSLAWDWSINEYRIKPEPTLVPWTYNTCHRNGWIKDKSKPCGPAAKIVNIGNLWVVVFDMHGKAQAIFFDALKKDYEYSQNGIDNWQPCGSLKE